MKKQCFEYAFGLGLMFVSAHAMSASSQLPNFDKLWDWNHPAQTRDKFNEILPRAEAAGDKQYLNELLTQIARTYSLQNKFTEANAVLDRVERQLPKAPDIATVRYYLERGRALNSAGHPDKAKPLFLKAFYLARHLESDNFAIDAAHMIAIAEKDLGKQREWTQTGLKIAAQSTDKRARGWEGPLANNLGWDYFDAGDYNKALPLFQQAYRAFKETGGEKQIDIARWTIARCQRALGEDNKALATQLALLKKYRQEGDEDGYVYEELGELYLTRGEKAKSRTYFNKAYKLISTDKWMMAHEQKRMARMKRLGGIGQ